MRRNSSLPLLAGRCSSTWDDGPNGYEWKSRALAEKRSLALEYLGNVNKRVQIHDAIRIKSDINKQAIQSFHMPDFFQGENEGKDDGPDEIDYDSLLSMIEGEIDPDTVTHISPADASLLKNELLYGDDTSDTKLLKKWINLRRETADYQSYAAIPEGERNMWSAWYLRNIRAASNRDD